MIVELAWDLRCKTGESPVWDEANRRVLFCDIPSATIHAFPVDGGATQSWTLPEVIGAFGLCRSGRLVVALRHRVVLFDPPTGRIAETGRIEELSAPVDEPATNRLNDGKVGPDGCFWIGSMDESPAHRPTGNLYRVRPDGTVERKAEGYVTSNGLAWSPDGRTLFHSDSRGVYVEAWDFDPTTGRLSAHRRVITLDEKEGRPDGGACDAEGDYWSSGVSAGCLNRISPDGKLLQKIHMPVSAPTMPCFAEAMLYVTSLRRDETEAQAGGLFRMKAPVAGAPVGLFADR